jgi:hypothetical protein
VGFLKTCHHTAVRGDDLKIAAPALGEKEKQREAYKQKSRQNTDSFFHWYFLTAPLWGEPCKKQEGKRLDSSGREKAIIKNDGTKRGIKMIKRQAGRKAAAFVITLLCVWVISAKTAVYAGGESQRKNTAAPSGHVFLESEPRVKPAWVNTIPTSETEKYFVGVSDFYQTEAGARDASRQNARRQVMEYYGAVLQSHYRERTAGSGKTEETLFSYFSLENEIQSFAENIVSEVANLQYYIEKWQNAKKETEYVVYSLHHIGRQKAENEIANFAKNISKRYTLSEGPTLTGTLESCTKIYKDLERNPLHQIVAYHESPGGNVNLFGYVRQRITDLSNSVSFEIIPSRAVQKTETMDTLVRLRPTGIQAIGPLPCAVNIRGVNAQGANTSIPNGRYTVNNDNSFLLPIQTSRLEPGSYTVQIELLFGELSGGIGKNISGGFSFEVTPLNAVLVSADDMETGIKRAVDTLAVGLSAPTDTRIGPFTLTGTEIATGLSQFLTEKISHYARNNRDGKYRLNAGESSMTSALSGFFTKRYDRVDVTLEFRTPKGEVSGSQIFALSAAELEKWDISIEPENLRAIQERERLFAALSGSGNTFGTTSGATGVNQAAQGIHIEAFFESQLGNHLYLHREPLKIKVRADRDCYFKIVHIDVNNQQKTIFPNSLDKNNYLRATRSTPVFENSSYMLYEPYGAETILVIVSTEQFRNIEQEYLEPWKAATAETIRTAVRGSRGGDLETAYRPVSFSGDGEARYTITILKPHEEYEYKPADMGEAIRALQNYTAQQGARLESLDPMTSGCYVVNGVRCSYRVPRNAPDIIQFAVYYINSYAEASSAGTKAKRQVIPFANLQKRSSP